MLMFLVISFIIPALYTGIVAHLSTPHIETRNWFVLCPSKQFDVFLSMNLILITVYLFLSYFLVRSLKGKAMKKHERYLP